MCVSICILIKYFSPRRHAPTPGPPSSSGAADRPGDPLPRRRLPAVPWAEMRQEFRKGIPRKCVAHSCGIQDISAAEEDARARLGERKGRGGEGRRGGTARRSSTGPLRLRVGRKRSLGHKGKRKEKGSVTNYCAWTFTNISRISLSLHLSTYLSLIPLCVSLASGYSRYPHNTRSHKCGCKC